MVIAMMMVVLMGVVFLRIDGDGEGGYEQTESVTGDLAECNGSFKMEMTVGVMR